MSQSYPPDPPNRRSNPSFDELIAIVVALAAMGGILFWVWGQNNKKLVQVPNQPTTQVSPTPGLTSMMERYLPDGVSPFSQTSPQPTTVQPQQSYNRPSGAVIGVIPPTTSAEATGVVPAPASVAGDPTTNTQPQSGATCATQPGAKGCSATPVAPAVVPFPITETPKTATSSSPSPTPQTAKTTASTSPSPTPQTPASSQKTAPQTARPLNVPQGYWATPVLAYFVEKNWAKGANNQTFKPDERITRAEFADQVEQAFNTQEEQKAIPFKDVPQNFWAETAIQEVSESGFLIGYPGQVFRPKQDIPRVQVLAALSSGLELEIPANPKEILKIYKDAAQIPEWAVGAVAAATQAGLVVNHPNKNTLNPNQPATYSEAAAMIYQGLVHRGKAEPINSNYIVNPQKGQ